MELAAIVTHLQDEDFKEDIINLIQTCASATEAEKKTLLVDFEKDIQSHLDQLDDIKDIEEIPVTLALKYIETKCRWINLNTQINYRLMRTGVPMELEMYRASILSHLLLRMEALLPPQDLQTICDFLSQPVGSGSKT